MTDAEEQLVAELAEALEDQFSYATQYATIVVDWREEAEALLPVVLADRRRAVAEALRGGAKSLRLEGEFRAAERVEAIADASTGYGCRHHRSRCETPNALCLLDCARADAVEGGGR